MSVKSCNVTISPDSQGILVPVHTRYLRNPFRSPMTAGATAHAKPAGSRRRNSEFKPIISLAYYKKQSAN